MYLFTYGTLMEGESRAGIMDQLGFEKIGECDAKGFLLFHFWYGKYPIILRSNSDLDIVKGEIYEGTLPKEYDKAILSILDGIEGEGDMYSRRIISVSCNGKKYEPYIYVGNYIYWKDLIKNGAISPLVNNLKWSQSFFEKN